MRKSTILVVVCCLALSACGREGPTDGVDSNSQLSVGLVMKDTTNPFFRLMADAAKAEAHEEGVGFTEQSPQYEADIQGQISRVESLISRRVGAIVVTASGEPLAPVLQRAHDAGIKVILLDQPLDGFTSQAALIETDNVAVGGAGAEELLKSIGGDASVGLIGFPGSPPVLDRINGATAVLEEADAGPVQIVNGKADQQASQNVTEDLIRAHPDLDGIFTCCGASSLGAIQAVKASNRGDIKVWGVDGYEAVYQAIADGKLDGTIAPRPDEMGKLGIQTAIRVLKGDSIESVVRVPFDVITKKNVTEYLK